MDAETALTTDLARANGEITPEQWAEVLEWVSFTPHGLVWHKGQGADESEWMPAPVYGVMCLGLGKAHGGLRWDIGDALNYSADRSEDYAQFEDAFGLRPATLDQYRRVCNRIPYAERPRYDGVPWTALQITAHLPTRTRDALVGAYTTGKIEDTTELRDEVRHIRALATGQPEAELLPPCPQCGGKLTSRRCKGCGLDFPAAVRWLHEACRTLDKVRISE